VSDLLPSTARRLPYVQPCLGTGDYHVEIRTRPTLLGPGRVVDEVPFKSGDWARRLNSSGSVSVTASVSTCVPILEKVAANWRYEIWIYRDDKVIAVGILLNITPDAEAGNITFAGPDLSAWLGRRVFLHTVKPDGIDLADIFEGYVAYALDGVMPEWGETQDGDPPLWADNPGITWEATPVGVTGTRTVYRTDYKYVLDELEEIAKTGVDWTMVGRQLWIGGLEVSAPGAAGQPLALPGRLTDEFFANPPRVRRTGEGMANVAAVRGNEQRHVLGGPDEDGVLLTVVLDEYSIEDEASALSLGNGYLDRGRYENIYAEGDSNLAASAPVSIDTLVPGTRTFVDLAGGGQPYRGWLRLDSVTGQFGAGEQGEVVRPTLQTIGSNADARGDLG
jgi:hypothetical protein